MFQRIGPLVWRRALFIGGGTLISGAGYLKIRGEAIREQYKQAAFHGQVSVMKEIDTQGKNWPRLTFALSRVGIGLKYPEDHKRAMELAVEGGQLAAIKYVCRFVYGGIHWPAMLMAVNSPLPTAKEMIHVIARDSNDGELSRDPCLVEKVTWDAIVNMGDNDVTSTFLRNVGPLPEARLAETLREFVVRQKEKSLTELLATHEGSHEQGSYAIAVRAVANSRSLSSATRKWFVTFMKDHLPRHIVKNMVKRGMNGSELLLMKEIIGCNALMRHVVDALH